MKAHTLANVNEGLGKIVPVFTLSGTKKLPYGQKEKIIREQYETWVPHLFVPDKYEVSDGSPRLKAIRKALLGVARRGRLFSKSGNNGVVGLKAPWYNSRDTKEHLLLF